MTLEWAKQLADLPTLEASFTDGGVRVDETKAIKDALREYVRLKEFENAVKEQIEEVNKMPSPPLDGDIKNKHLNEAKMFAKLVAFTNIGILVKEGSTAKAK